MSKNDKYKVELHSLGIYMVCVEGKPVTLTGLLSNWRGTQSQPLGFEDATVAEDMCYLLNQAFMMRMERDKAEREFDQQNCQHVYQKLLRDGSTVCKECGVQVMPGLQDVCQHDWGKNLICAKCGKDGTKVGKQ